MRARARSYRHDDFADDDFLPGERIGPPLRTRGQIFLRRALVVLIAAGGGWELYVHRTTWPGWLSAQTAAVSAALERSPSRAAEPVTWPTPPRPPPFVAVSTPKPVAEAPPLPPPSPATTATAASPATKMAALPPAAGGGAAHEVNPKKRQLALALRGIFEDAGVGGLGQGGANGNAGIAVVGG